MASKVVQGDRAIPIYLSPGVTVTFTNYDAANDVFLNSDPNELNAALPATNPRGAKIAHGGGQLQIAIQKTGVIWARTNSLAAVIIDVD